jgi:hypothetical protein
MNLMIVHLHRVMLDLQDNLNFQMEHLLIDNKWAYNLCHHPQTMFFYKTNHLHHPSFRLNYP